MRNHGEKRIHATFTCPKCGWLSKYHDKNCDYCGEEIRPNGKRKCENCGITIQEEDVYCFNCGSKLSRDNGKIS